MLTEMMMKIAIENWDNILIICVMLITINFLKSPKGKGWIGEVIVNTIIKLRLSKKEYILMKNITMPTKDGSTQIDQIIVSKYGVFVLETKNMKGSILLDKKWENWTQKIGNYKWKFQNSLRQNYKHTKTLEESLEIESRKIKSIVVFVGSAKLNGEIPENVLYLRELIKYIKSKTRIIIRDKEVIEIVKRIRSKEFKKGWETNKRHVGHVRDIISRKDL